MIETHADEMRWLKRLEGFVGRRNARYRAHVRSFERVTDDLIRQAKSKNTDQVTPAHRPMTVSCVRCHQTVRETPAVKSTGAVERASPQSTAP